MVEKIAEQRAQALIQQRQQQDAARQIVQSNYKTFVEHDPSGRPVYEFVNGQQQERLTPQGRFYVEQAQEARERGLKDPTHIHEYAMGRLQLALMHVHAQQSQQVQQGQQAAQQFAQSQPHQPAANLNPAAHTPNVSAAPQSAMTLEQKMLQMFKQGGYTDQRLMDEMTQR